MYEKCLKCEELGKKCFPNFYIMPVDDMRDFARNLKEEKHMSNADIAKISGIPKGTVDNSFSKKNADVYYTTFAPILCALIGSDGEESPCPAAILKHIEQSVKYGNDSNDHNDAEYKLNTELVSSFEQRIEQLERENRELNKRLRDDDQYYKNVIQRKNQAIRVLGVALFIFASIIIISLIIDKYDTAHGFFWMTQQASIISV